MNSGIQKPQYYVSPGQPDDQITLLFRHVGDDAGDIEEWGSFREVGEVP